MRRETILFSVTLSILLLHFLLPINHPPTFHLLSSAGTPTLETLLLNLPNSATTPLHAAYKKLSRCSVDLPALRHAITQITPIRHNLVICLCRPLTTHYLHFIRALSNRLGNPYITTTDAHILSRLARVNITPILPNSPDEALSAMAAAENLLVTTGISCAFGARVARGVVYYTNEYQQFIARNGYEWLPENSARLDGYDRSHRALLSAVGTPQESCCRFQNGLCHPLPEACRAVVMGRLKEPIGCRVVNVCKNGTCPKWADIVKAGVPHVLLMDLGGTEFEMLKQIYSTTKLPRQIVLRMRVWADREISGWVKGKSGWVVKRDDVIETVHRLRKTGYRLVHRVDDPACEWCAFLTFLKS